MKKKLTALWERQSFMTQGIAVNCAIITILAVMAFILAQCFIKSYGNMLSSQLSTILEISTDSVQSTVEGIENVSMDFMVNDDLLKSFQSLTSSETYSYEDFVAANELKKYVLDLANDNRAVKFAVLLDKEYHHVVSAMGQNPSWTDEMSEAVEHGMSDGSRYKWLAPQGALSDLIAVREIVDLSDPELTLEGLLVLGIDIQALVTEKNSNLKGYPLSSLVMSDEDVIYSDFQNSDDAKLFMDKITEKTAAKSEIRFNGRKYFCTYKELDTAGWKYAVYVPHREVMGRLETVLTLCGIAFLAIVFLVVYISFLSAKRMVRPLAELSEQMKKVENGVFEGVKVTEGDSKNEINSLAMDFNVMIRQIDILIQENYLKQMLLQESELKLLQSQINPHFLYNTLESINWMAKSGRTKEISIMVQALSKLFRSAVNNKESVISVAEELALLSNYIAIQSIRFEERLEVYVDVDEEFYDYKVPKLILQPLVENSIKYALERFKSTCVISIYSVRTENGMKLYVNDNGPGIEAERLALIRENKPFESRSGIALKNIRRRMEITYHNKDAMEIESEPGKGTTIILNIPEKIEE